MIRIERNCYHCQGAGSWLQIQIGLTCIMLMAFWRKPNERGISIALRIFAPGSPRFGFWLFTARKSNALFYWASKTLLIVLLSALSVCGADAVKMPDLGNGVALQAADPAAPVIHNEIKIPQPPAPVNTINVPAQPPAINNVSVAAPVTDFNALLTAIGGALFTAITSLLGLWKLLQQHHGQLSDARAWEDLLAHCFQQAGGDPATALTLVSAAHWDRFGEAPSAVDLVDAKHSLSALQLTASGPTREDPEIMEAKQKLADVLAKKRSVAGAVLAGLMVLALLLVLPGCLTTTTAAQDTVKKIQADKDNLVKNTTATCQALAAYYLNSETNRENVRFCLSLKSDTRPVQIAGGTTINYIDPNTSASLTRIHEANLALIGATYNSIEQRIAAMTADSPNIDKLADSLTSYLQGATANTATIQASANEVLNIVTSLVPAPATTPQPKADVLPTK